MSNELPADDRALRYLVVLPAIIWHLLGLLLGLIYTSLALACNGLGWLASAWADLHRLEPP